MEANGSFIGAAARAGAGMRERRLGRHLIFEADPGRAKKVAPETWAFKGYKARFMGEGDPPADQARRIRVTFGLVRMKIALPPSNISEEFLVPANTEHIFFVKTTHLPDGSLQAVEIDHAADVPTEDPGLAGVAPSHSYCELFRVSTDADTVTLISPLKKASLQISIVVADVACGSNTLGYQWTS